MPEQSPDERLNELFAAHHRQVVAYVARRTHPLGDQALAQDVASEVFTLAWQRLSQRWSGAAPEDAGRANGSRRADATLVNLPWLLVTARNVLSQRHRDDARRAVREERAGTDRSTGTAPASGTTDPAEALALSEQVARALDRLQPDDRELLLLRVWDELPFADVAAALGCSPGAARVRWLRARRRFAAALTRENAEGGSPTPVDHPDRPSPHPDRPSPAPGVTPLPLTTIQTGALR